MGSIKKHKKRLSPVRIKKIIRNPNAQRHGIECAGVGDTGGSRGGGQGGVAGTTPLLNSKKISRIQISFDRFHLSSSK